MKIMWSYEITEREVKLWRGESGKGYMSFARKPDTPVQNILNWLYELASLNVVDINDRAELQSFVIMVQQASERLVGP